MLSFIINFLFLQLDEHMIRTDFGRTILLWIKKKLDIAYFLSFCIEQYKMKQGLSGEEAISLFEKYNVLSYLSDNSEVLHTQSQQWLMEEIKEYITKQKKANQWNYTMVV